MTKVLVIEDDMAFGLMLRTWLKKQGFEADGVASGAEAMKRIGNNRYDIVLSDLRLPDTDGITLLEWIRHKSPDSEVIMMTSYAGVDTAVAAIKLGAFDYLQKPVNPEILNEKITAVLAARKMKKDNPEPVTSDAIADLSFVMGNGEASRKLYNQLRVVAPTNMSVLIMGESGTGKEYAARFIHNNSKRKDYPFIAVDCGALSRELGASELFGHVKGAFTSAVSDKKGVFETADHGTVFLDEIGNLSYEVQVQLLRAIQERIIRPVGSMKEISVDVRIIAATNENLQDAIRENRFREDLYHRINELAVYVPPLRERGDDIMTFASVFLQDANRELEKNIKGFDKETEKWLCAYGWSGNLRQMKNAIKRAVLFCPGEIISLSDLPDELTKDKSGEQSFVLSDPNDEKKRILEALAHTGNNKSKAAKLLGIDRKTLYNKLSQYEIELS
ncbi:MAG TPA: sigma-54-dependent Fis family transcriptional regulator [Candidatus Avirikenella pullistercoris]|nr:sigma-54-dependent Fis family transcriptional regulator [Candidatus Avirikenella pullistercoris]